MTENVNYTNIVDENTNFISGQPTNGTYCPVPPQHPGPCPNCGYCPCCGRSNHPVPIYPFPPYTPVWVTTQTQTVSNGDAESG